MKLIKRARDGIWLLEYLSPEGKRTRLSTGKRERTDAERMAHQILAGQGPRAPAHTVNDALDHAWMRRWKDQKGSRQLHYVVEQVRAKFGKWGCSDLTYAVLDEYAHECLDAGLKPATINHRLGVLSVALDLAIKRNRLATMPPFPRMTVANGRIRYITREEEARLLEHAEGMTWHLIVVLVDTGARLSEITSLQPTDVVDGQIRLIDTKNGKSRAVPLTDRAAVSMRWLHACEQWREVTRGAATSLVRKASAKDYLVKQFSRVRDAADLPDVSMHILRHTCASRLVQAGVDLYRVKAWLGHSTVQMTERYAHLAPTSLRDAASVLEQPTGTVVPFTRKEA